jgi:uncharacterized protein
MSRQGSRFSKLLSLAQVRITFFIALPSDFEVSEILLFGTGNRVEMPPPAVRKYLNDLGIQVDVMDTVSDVITGSR